MSPLAQRAEAAGLNASAPPQEARIDGWLIRLSPGRAKRSRCVNALAAGDMPLQQLLARCRPAFAAAGLPVIVRVTPFSQPVDLDAQLAALGWYAFDAADVLVLDSLENLPAAPALKSIDSARYARVVGELRGSSETAIAAHAERMQQAPVAYQGFVLEAAGSALLACGQMVVDGPIVGLYDIFTPPAQRGQGHAQALCAGLLHAAREQGAVDAYLQVGRDNAVAQRLYKRLGFSFAYQYHYRSDDPSAAD